MFSSNPSDVSTVFECFWDLKPVRCTEVTSIAGQCFKPAARKRQDRGENWRDRGKRYASWIPCHGV